MHKENKQAGQLTSWMKMNFVATSQLLSARDEACKAQRALLNKCEEQDYVSVGKKQNSFYH